MSNDTSSDSDSNSDHETQIVSPQLQQRILRALFTQTIRSRSEDNHGQETPLSRQQLIRLMSQTNEEFKSYQITHNVDEGTFNIKLEKTSLQRLIHTLDTNQESCDLVVGKLSRQIEALRVDEPSYATALSLNIIKQRFIEYRDVITSNYRQFNVFKTFWRGQMLRYIEIVNLAKTNRVYGNEAALTEWISQVQSWIDDLKQPFQLFGLRMATADSFDTLIGSSKLANHFKEARIYYVRMMQAILVPLHQTMIDSLEKRRQICARIANRLIRTVEYIEQLVSAFAHVLVGTAGFCLEKCEMSQVIVDNIGLIENVEWLGKIDIENVL